MQKGMYTDVKGKEQKGGDVRRAKRVLKFSHDTCVKLI
jgi:hypothetical protein